MDSFAKNKNHDKILYEEKLQENDLEDLVIRVAVVTAPKI